LQTLLFTCYQKLFSAGHLIQNLRGLNYRDSGIYRKLCSTIAMTAFNRYSAWSHVHPMSGGMQRVRQDRVGDFGRLRSDTYGFELAPLPQSLQLQADESTIQRAFQLDTTEPLPRPA
jgi:hypothetical protein